MKLAISNIAWENDENEAVYKLMQKYGFTGLEIAPTKIWSEPFSVSAKEIGKFRNSLESQGVKIAAMQALLFGHPEMTIFESKEARSKTLNHLKKMIDLGESLGATALVFGSPKNRIIGKLAKSEASTIAKDFFTELGTYSKQKKIFFCLEPNPKEYGADFLTTTNQAYTFIRKIANQGLKVNLDTGTIIMNKEDSSQLTNYDLQQIGHFHISEPFLNPIGEYEDKHKELAGFLKKRNYTNWISIEMKATGVKGNLNNIEKALKLVNKIYA